VTSEDVFFHALISATALGALVLGWFVALPL